MGDYSLLMGTISESEARKIQVGLPITLLTAGLCVFIIIAFGCEANDAINAFNEKYKDQGIKAIDITKHGGGAGGGGHGGGGPFMVMFKYPAPAVVAAVPAPVVMARDDSDPAEKLAKLKAMLDDGLITEADYDAKKADILANM